MASDRTPRATKAALVGVLALTGVLVLLYARGGNDPGPRATGLALAVLTALFAVRVGGQLLVRARAPAFLPPMEDWNLMPYRLLLPIQLAFLALMSLLCAGLLLDSGPVAERSRAFGVAAIAFAAVYAGAMAIRYTVRMARRPAERWFGGTIPVVFHLVLASFVFVLGSFHAAG